jgi:hypothetical protein
MPFEGELASYKSLHRLANSERVQELLGSYETRPRGTTDASAPLVTIAAPASDWLPDIVLAIDSSHAEVPLENGFPGAEASYITVSSVLLDVAKMRQLDSQRPVDPREFRKIEEADSIDCALPGCNVVCHGQGSAPASLRRKLFEEFVYRRMDSGGETLLETYEALLVHKPPETDPTKAQKCPYAAEDDCQGTDELYRRDSGEYVCRCSLSRPLYSTDALRIHEGMNPAGTNGAMFAEIMQVWERIWVVHFLRTMERKGWLSSLRRIAVILDGPLAVFGHPAWLSSAIEQELKRLNEAARQVNGGQDILLLGIEKSGPFLDHFMNLDTHPDGAPNRFPSQTVGLIDDAYIKRNIIFSQSDRPYGRQTYFGRKFFYKTRTGALLIGLLPHLRPGDDDLLRADPDQFPRLADALAVLDELVCVRYPNSLSALVAAHAEAAIPLHLGNDILGQLARRLVNTSGNSGSNLDSNGTSP